MVDWSIIILAWEKKKTDLNYTFMVECSVRAVHKTRPFWTLFA